MLEFTSALYLGLRHPSRSLKPWVQLTTGVPAALAVPSVARAVARELAALQGCEAATLGPSTLHLFLDLGQLFAESRVAIYLDAGSYPIGKWGMERAAICGTPLQRFAHHDPESLQRLLHGNPPSRRPVVVCDGFCPGCGRPAPLRSYLNLAAPAGGWLVIDDTQALGIFGSSPDARRPYGEGGGGMLRFSRLSSPRRVVVASLAKAFGTPVAALSGCAAFVRQFEQRSGTRMHCSPPSLAAIGAMSRALTINRTHGEELRARLTRLISRFRARLREAGLVPIGGMFPVQTLPPISGIDVLTMHDRLRSAGISTVLHRHRRGDAARISFLITARHDFDEIDRAADAVGEILARTGSNTAKERDYVRYLHV